MRRAGATLEITPTEFKLLLAFIRNRGRVLTRENLLDEAWGKGMMSPDGFVELVYRTLK